MVRVVHTENISHHFHFKDLLLFLYIITIRETFCIIQLPLNVLYEVYNPLAQHFQN